MKRWTEAEREFLRKYYYMLEPNFLALKLPGRTRQAIRSQVQYLRKRGWSFNK